MRRCNMEIIDQTRQVLLKDRLNESLEF